ncbi:MAG: xanthine dehydrogenase accessory protein XdhC [Xanthomonadales bacterium]|nr:xanthine dehydrogenase accessory protein XdhC [Xanthomonadales bacterium]
MHIEASHHQHIQQLSEHSIDFVSIQIIAIKGSAPQVVGAKMLVTADCNNSPFSGTVGGGKLELFAIEHAKKLLATDNQQATDNISLNLQKDISMTCGGVVQLFFEVYRHSSWNIAVFGAGHISQALIPILLTLNCKIQCFDSRTNWLEKLPDSPALTTTRLDELADAIERVPANSYIIAVTRGHSEDVKIVEKLFQHRNPPFIGIIGSKSKAVAIKKQLKALGIKQNQLEQIHCPVGLPIGENIPSEIAISIAAQLLQLKPKLSHLE